LSDSEIFSDTKRRAVSATAELLVGHTSSGPRKLGPLGTVYSGYSAHALIGACVTVGTFWQVQILRSSCVVRSNYHMLA